MARAGVGGVLVPRKSSGKRYRKSKPRKSRKSRKPRKPRKHISSNYLLITLPYGPTQKIIGNLDVLNSRALIGPCRALMGP